MTILTRDALFKKYFHSHDADGAVEWQGQIVAVGEEFFLIELYDWVVGQPMGKYLISIAKMENWTFYDSIEEMNEVYNVREKYLGRRVENAT